jgi:ADP-ribose pyrophosphatase
MQDPLTFQRSLPRKRMAAGALILDQNDRILIVKPSYRSDWLIPGGIIEADESPLQACARELHEEVGLELPISIPLCIEYSAGDEKRTESMQFVFDGGICPPELLAQIRPQAGEIEQVKWASFEEAQQLLNPRLALRVRHAYQARRERRTVYLENGEVIL